MTFQKIIRQFIPPIVGKVVDRVARLFPGGKADYFEYCPDAWERVDAANPDRGWNVAGLVEGERLRWEAFGRNAGGTGPLGFSHEYADQAVVDSPYFHNVHITFGYALALAAQQRPTVSVLDYGGSLGHYFLIGKALLPEVHLDYHVKEVPKMAALGRQLNPGVVWHENDDCLDAPYDLIMSNGSLDYIRDWRGCVARFGKSASRYVLITRVKVVSQAPSYAALHRSPHGDIAHWQINETELKDAAREAGLTMIRELVVGDPVPTRGAPDRCVLKGWLFKREAS